ncbi:MAG: DUF885 domain-containing protein [Balneolaceae bacterium]
MMGSKMSETGWSWKFRKIATGLLAAIWMVSAAGCETEQADHETQLHELIDDTQHFQIRVNPYRADSDGNYLENDKLPGESIDDLRERNEYWLGVMEQLEEEIDRESLDANHRITYDTFHRSVRNNIAEFEYQTYLTPTGFFTNLNGLPNRTETDDVQGYEDYLSRLSAAPAYFDQYLDRLKLGIEIGYTPPRILYSEEEFESDIQPLLVQNAEESSLFGPFEEFPDGIGEADRERFRAEGTRILEEEVLPKYHEIYDFFVNEYHPNIRESIGVGALPDGEEYYQHMVEYHTTLPMTAQEVHDIGLQEVERIRNEMLEIIEEVGFDGGLTEFLEFLRTDSQFYVDTPEELLREAGWLAKRMDGKLPEIFHVRNLPRRSYGVAPVPAHLAPNYTGGRYYVGRGDEAGQYWVNTYDLPSRPLYTLEALAYHEGIPGHHLDFALAQELDDAPRRVGGITAYSEGWALYAERLGLDVGLYDNPYYNFGRLTYEMWRACRLVVDTGMHVFGWTRQETIDFMTQNTALSHREIEYETDRYIRAVGQALSYKIGELKIRELRERAAEALGEEFDLRDFHEAVLQRGPVLLTTLEEQVVDYFSDRFDVEI